MAHDWLLEYVLCFKIKGRFVHVVSLKWSDPLRVVKVVVRVTKLGMTQNLKIIEGEGE